MTLHEWRSSGERRSIALDLLNNPTVQEILAVMETEHPSKQPRPVNDGFGATQELGRIKGFQEALSMLRSFAEPLPTAQENIPVTWGVSEDDQPKT